MLRSDEFADEKIRGKITPLENLVKKSRQDLDSIRYILHNLEVPIESYFDNRIKLSGDSYNLDRNLTSHKPSEIRFRGNVHFAKNWNQVIPWLASEIISLKVFTEEELVKDKAFFWEKKTLFFGQS